MLRTPALAPSPPVETAGCTLAARTQTCTSLFIHGFKSLGAVALSDSILFIDLAMISMKIEWNAMRPGPLVHARRSLLSACCL